MLRSVYSLKDLGNVILTDDTMSMWYWPTTQCQCDIDRWHNANVILTDDTVLMCNWPMTLCLCDIDRCHSVNKKGKDCNRGKLVTSFISRVRCLRNLQNSQLVQSFVYLWQYWWAEPFQVALVAMDSRLHITWVKYHISFNPVTKQQEI